MIRNIRFSEKIIFSNINYLMLSIFAFIKVKNDQYDAHFI
jgi:hypothetical protein